MNVPALEQVLYWSGQGKAVVDQLRLMTDQTLDNDFRDTILGHIIQLKIHIDEIERLSQRQLTEKSVSVV